MLVSHRRLMMTRTAHNPKVLVNHLTKSQNQKIPALVPAAVRESPAWIAAKLAPPADIKTKSRAQVHLQVKLAECQLCENIGNRL